MGDSSPTEEGTKPTTDTEGDCNSPMNDGVEKEKNPGEEATDKESLDDSGEAKKDESDDDDDDPPNEYKKKAKIDHPLLQRSKKSQLLLKVLKGHQMIPKMANLNLKCSNTSWKEAMMMMKARQRILMMKMEL